MLKYSHWAAENMSQSNVLNKNKSVEIKSKIISRDSTWTYHLELTFINVFELAYISMILRCAVTIIQPIGKKMALYTSLFSYTNWK